MFIIHIRGSKKAVYMLRHNLLGYGLPDITYEDGNEDSYIMHCEMETSHDAIPNQHSFGDAPEEWDGMKLDLSEISMDEIKSGQHDYEYSNHELDILSGIIDVDIEILNDPDDKWWEDIDVDVFEDLEGFDVEGMEVKPQYPFYAYSKGKEITNKCFEEEDDPNIFSF